MKLKLYVVEMGLEPESYHINKHAVPLNNSGELIDKPCGFSIETNITFQSTGDVSKFFKKDGALEVGKVMDYIFRGKIKIQKTEY